jgi:glycine reductase complex component B subunit alpha and beta
LTLELATFPVSELQLADSSPSRYDDGFLLVNRRELLAILGDDDRLEEVNLAVATPGESTRIVPVHDVIEPRTKVSGEGVVFPGVAGRPITTVGSGRTHRLSGVAVVESAPLGQYGGDPGWSGDTPAYLDMSGPAAIQPYSDLHLLVILAKPRSRLSARDQSEAAWTATLRAAIYLAELTNRHQPAEVEVLDAAVAPGDLPGVAYMPLYNSPEHYGGSRDAFGTAIYGHTELTHPWVLHGNEYFDGALARRGTWVHQNQPQVRDLLARHGLELNFVGVVAQRTRWTRQDEKRWTARQAAKIAKQLGATGAIITWDYGGNDYLEVAYTLEACEELGIRTVFMTVEEKRPGDPGTVFFLPEKADAVVSTGGYSLTEVPAPSRWIGFEYGSLSPTEIARGENVRPAFGQWDYYGLCNFSNADF